MRKSSSIPSRVQWGLRQRLEKHAAAGYADRCRAVSIRFHGAFAYVDAIPSSSGVPGNSGQQSADIDEAPLHLCRLRYLGSADSWEFSFFKYSTEKYERSFTLSGSFIATPEEAFDTSALAYLQG